jgi:hypothetical protein
MSVERMWRTINPGIKIVRHREGYVAGIRDRLAL